LNIKQIINSDLIKALLISTFILACNNSNHNEEYKILSDNFGSLLDSTLIDRRRLVVPSPEDFRDSTSQSNLKERVKIKNDIQLSPLTVVLRDSISPISDLDSFYEDIRQFKSNYKSIIENEFIENEVYKIDISSFKIDNSKYELISYFEFEKRKELLDETRKTSDVPIYSLSRIYFNKDQNFGAFKMNIVYGRLDAYGVIVFIKKENNEWVIDQIIEDWVS
jgi:hypothetical protein